MTTVEEIKQSFHSALSHYKSNNKQPLYDWFIKHEYLKLNELTTIVGINYYSLQRYRSNLGIKKSNAKKVTVHRSRKVINLTIKEDWLTDIEYLKKIGTNYSSVVIAKAVGLKAHKVREILSQYNIRYHNKHRYNTREWCHDHYVVKNMSALNCSKLAGVSVATFYTWLTAHDIKLKHKYGSLPIWLRKFINDIKPYIKTIRIRGKYIYIRYNDNCVENYNFQSTLSYRAIREEDTNIGDVPTIYYQFGTGLDGTINYPHLMISKKEYKRATKFGQILALHQFLYKLRTAKWCGLAYPHKYLVNDLKALSSQNSDDFCTADGFRLYLYSHNKPGKAISDHYFYSEYKRLLLNKITKEDKRYGTPVRNYKLLQYIANKRRYNICTSSLLSLIEDARPYTCRFIESKYPGSIPQYVNPQIYSILFERLNIRSILDIYPNFGFRSMGCALSKIKYYTIPTKQFNEAIDNGYDKFINLDWEPYSNQFVDAIMCDKDMRLSDLGLALRYKQFAKAIILFVGHNHFTEWYSRYNPQSVIEVDMINNFNKASRKGYYFVL